MDALPTRCLARTTMEAVRFDRSKWLAAPSSNSDLADDLGAERTPRVARHEGPMGITSQPLKAHAVELRAGHLEDRDRHVDPGLHKALGAEELARGDSASMLVVESHARTRADALREATRGAFRWAGAVVTIRREGSSTNWGQRANRVPLVCDLAERLKHLAEACQRRVRDKRTSNRNDCQVQRGCEAFHLGGDISRGARRELHAARERRVLSITPSGVGGRYKPRAELTGDAHDVRGLAGSLLHRRCRRDPLLGKGARPDTFWFYRAHAQLPFQRKRPKL
mmetsp:Transcript_9878/g.26019  ORF Transcript_9878/g.26019 Transcript_9878/m.26019 type:complete len:281 (-) Transcript_9878:645-1487(-)